MIAKLNKARDVLTHAPFLWRLLITFISGVALSFIQAPYHLWGLLFLSLGCFYLLFDSCQTKKSCFFSAFVFFFGYFIFGLHWIGNALLVEGNEYAWAYPLAVVALPLGLSLLSALHFILLPLFFKSFKGAGKFLLFCAIFAMSEWTRGHAFTGFPWNLVGYGWISVLPVAQSVLLIGSYGLTLFTIFWGCTLGYVIAENSARSKITFTAIAFLSFLGFYSFGLKTLSSHPTEFNTEYEFQIIQPNIAQADKWNPKKLVENFEKHIALSASNAAITSKRIIVWSETALSPVLIYNQAAQQRIQSILNPNDILISGVLDKKTDSESGLDKYYNAIGAWQKTKGYQRVYSKSHLVPFGEYIPFSQYIPIPTITQFSGFERGEGIQNISIEGFPDFSPFICYEIIFPQTLGNKINPDYILTITNDGWYGDSAGPYQHFAQSRFRAIEQGIPVVRATNTGISGIIDPKGRVINKLGLMENGIVAGNLPIKSISPPLYSEYGDLVFGFISSLFLLSALVIHIRKKL